MSQTVSVPGVGDLEFPDGMSQPDMAAAIRKNFPEIHTDAPSKAGGSPEPPPVQEPVEPEPTTYGGIIKRAGTDFLSALPNRGVGGALLTSVSNEQNRALSMLGADAGEAALTGGQRLGLPPELSAGLATAAHVGVRDVLPTVMGGGAGARGASMLEHQAETLMQSALKPTLRQLKTGEAATAVRTLLDEGINVSKGGLKKLRDKIDTLNDEIRTAIANSPAVVNKAAVARYLNDLMQRFKTQVNPRSDMDAVRRAFDEFWDHPQLIGRRTLPVSEAQKMKQGTYKALGDKSYGELKGADIEAQKTLAHGLKEEIAKAVPEVAGLNAQESRLIKTLNVAERRMLMDANKNPMGLALLAKDPAAAAAFVADRSPLFKSLIARMINYNARAITGGAGAVAGGATATYTDPASIFGAYQPRPMEHP